MHQTFTPSPTPLQKLAELAALRQTMAALSPKAAWTRDVVRDGGDQQMRAGDQHDAKMIDRRRQRLSGRLGAHGGHFQPTACYLYSLGWVLGRTLTRILSWIPTELGTNGSVSTDPNAGMSRHANEVDSITSFCATPASFVRAI